MGRRGPVELIGHAYSPASSNLFPEDTVGHCQRSSCGSSSHNHSCQHRSSGSGGNSSSNGSCSNGGSCSSNGRVMVVVVVAVVVAIAYAIWSFRNTDG